MTTFTLEHKQRLERATHNRFLDECVAKLKKLDLQMLTQKRKNNTKSSLKLDILMPNFMG